MRKPGYAPGAVLVNTTALLATKPGECCAETDFLEADFWTTFEFASRYLLSECNRVVDSRLASIENVCRLGIRPGRFRIQTRVRATRPIRLPHKR